MNSLGVKLWLVGFLSFCSSLLYAQQNNPIFVSIAPYKAIIEQLIDHQYPVEVLVSHGSSPETYDPAPEQFKKLMRAHLYFAIGLPIEKRLQQKLSSNKQQSLRWIALNPEHEHQDSHDHHDIHSWLDPLLMRQHIELISRQLAIEFPHLNATIDKQKQQLLQKIEQLHHKIESLFSNSTKHNFLIYHPGLSFFSKRYGLKQISIEQDGKSPSTQTYVRLVHSLRQQQVQFLLYENNNHARTIENIAEQLDLDKLPINLLAANYFSNLWHIANQVKKASY